jgi:hypothetical protein
MSSEDDAAESRRKIIAKARAAAAAESSSDDSSSSEEDTTVVRLKPVFVPKNQRTTVSELQERESAEAQLEQQRQLDEEEFLARKRQRAVQEAVIAEEIESKNLDDPIGAAPPIGIEDTEEEYQLWKLRELKRILLYREGKKWEDVQESCPVEEAPKSRSGGVFFKQAGSAKQTVEETKSVDEMAARIVKQMGGMKDI